MNKRIEISLSTQSMAQAVKEIEKLKGAIERARIDFIKLSVDWLLKRASDNIAVNYPDFVNDFRTAITGNLGILETTEEQMTYIEFGTGIVGKSSPHELADENDYQYDVNAHGEKGWTFTHYADNKLDVKESNIISRSKGNHSGLWKKIRTRGAEAERFMFNALSDFYNGGVYGQIYKQALESAMR